MNRACSFLVLGTLFLFVTCAFNDIHQDALGRGMLLIWAIAGAGLLIYDMVCRRPFLIFKAIGIIYSGYLFVSLLGLIMLKINYNERGMEEWRIETISTGTPHDEVELAQSVKNPRGTIVVFNQGHNEEQFWILRRFLYDNTRNGWRLLIIDSDFLDYRLLAENSVPGRPIVVITYQGGVPMAFDFAVKPNFCIYINPGFVDVVEADPARCIVLFAGPEQRNDAEKLASNFPWLKQIYFPRFDDICLAEINLNSLLE